VSPAMKTQNPAYHLAFGDVVVDNRTVPTHIQVRIKPSKTDSFRPGVTVHIGKTDNCLCPVIEVLAYMVARGAGPGPLFRWEDGRFLTREAFVMAVTGRSRPGGTRLCGS